MLALEILGWVIFCYGALSLTRDILDEYTYKKINNNMKIYITLENIEQNLEYFIREISSIKRRNKLKNISIINLDIKKEEDIILKKIEEELNVKIIDYYKFTDKIKCK